MIKGGPPAQPGAVTDIVQKHARRLAEYLRGGTFEGKNPSPEEANTRVRLSILYGVPIVNK
jgi:hypothetical protein